jgi:hypothetical protein
VRFCVFAFLLVCARVLGVYVYLLAFLLVRTFDTVSWRVLVPGNGTADEGATAIAAALAANRTLTSVDLAGASGFVSLSSSGFIYNMCRSARE